nr:hypothetical protein [Streptomyces klenkii]
MAFSTIEGYAVRPLKVGGRAGEELGRDRGAVVAQGQCHRRGEVSARAVPGQRERAPAEPGAMSRDMAGDGQAVVVPGREGMLGGEPVADADHHRLQVAAQPAAYVVVGVQVADNPATP